MSSPPEQM